MNLYAAYWRGKCRTVRAETSLAAQTKAAAEFRAKKSYEVTVVLVQKDGKEVTHSTAELG